MPKVIENLREKMLKEGKEILIKNKYDELNLRDLSKKCEIGIGTFYNYFSNKEEFVLEIFNNDWQQILNIVDELKDKDYDLKTKLKEVYINLEVFIDTYMCIFYELSMNSEYKNERKKSFEDMNFKIQELLEKEYKKNRITSTLPTKKLSNLILSNFFIICKDKYITFDEWYENFKI